MTRQGIMLLSYYPIHVAHQQSTSSTIIVCSWGNMSFSKAKAISICYISASDKLYGSIFAKLDMEDKSEISTLFLQHNVLELANYPQKIKLDNYWVYGNGFSLVSPWF